MKRLVFTPNNLIDNLDKLGPWSIYFLASEALKQFFPEVYKNGDLSVQEEAKLMEEMLGCQHWDEVVLKYQNEIGYKGPFNPDYVNEY
jgi:hypothetical protein